MKRLNKAMVNGYNAAMDRIEEEIGFIRGKVLDIGCSDGSGMVVMGRRWEDVKVFGVEVNTARVAECWKRGLDVRRVSAEELPFSPLSIDFVFSRHVLEHVENRGIALAEMYRVLVDGGYIYIQVPIEKGGSKNKLHISAFNSQEEARGAFKMLFDEVYWGPQETVVEFIGVKK